MRFGYTSITNLCGTAAISKLTNKLEFVNKNIVVLNLTLPALVVGLCSLKIYLRWKATQRNLLQNTPGNAVSGNSRRETVASLAMNKYAE
jgi:hypothetical protein